LENVKCEALHLFVIQRIPVDFRS
jgi:hypothetical protein